MRVIARKTLRDFWGRHRDAGQQLKAWFKEAETAHWSSPAKIKEEYPRASIVANNRVVFDICGGKYRLVVAVDYQRGFVWIRFIGSHAEYDKLDASTC